MRYRSTRCDDGRTYSFEEAVLAGWARDGGMLLPVLPDSPVVSHNTLRAWAHLDYVGVCVEVFKLFAGDCVTEDALRALVSRAFQDFGDPAVVTLRPGGAGALQHVHAAVAELWHGPTLAFKDLGLTVLLLLLEEFLRRRGERRTLLVGTSGDTGAVARPPTRPPRPRGRTDPHRHPSCLPPPQAAPP